MSAFAGRAAIACVLALSAVPVVAARHDIDGDRRDDVAWRHATTGGNLLWLAGDPAKAVPVTSVASLQWKIVGIGDFDGDAHADLLWRNTVSGSNTIWRRGNPRTQQVVAYRDPKWRVLGVGDFNGDRRVDVLWTHDTLGHVVWPAANAAAAYGIPGVQFVAIADLNGDGRDDLVGRTGVYFPSAFHYFAWSGADSTRSFDLGIVSSYELAGWALQAIGDFDGDGHDDLFWRNLRDGRNMAWRAGYPASRMAVATVSDLAWKVQSAGDYDGDGRSDLFWRHQVRTSTAVWFAANAAMARSLVPISTLWSVAGTP